MNPILSKLKLKRLLLCKSQQEVADAIAISQSYLSHLECGREPLNGEILIKLAKYYGCMVKELI